MRFCGSHAIRWWMLVALVLIVVAGVFITVHVLERRKEDDRAGGIVSSGLTATPNAARTPTILWTPTTTSTPIPSTTPTSTATCTPTTIVSQPVRMLIYPYLGATTHNDVVISWVTDGPAQSEVRYSLDQSYANVVTATASIHDGKHWHSATISNLTAGTTYYYKVLSGGQDLTAWPRITFTTAPESTASRFTFAVLGDSRPEDDDLPPSAGARAVAAQLREHPFDFALHAGDIVYSGGICSGQDSSWEQYIRAYFDLYRESVGHVSFFPSVGNHEVTGGICGYRGYTDIYHLPANAPAGDEEEYYSFDWGNAHFVALDSNQSCSPGSAQYSWLVNDLANSTQPWKFVFFHHPVYSSGSYGGSLSLRSDWVPLFETHGVNIVFNGHDHHYERTCPILEDACSTPRQGGVVYYVTGGAGAPLYRVGSDWFTAYSGSLHHFLLVEVSGCQLRVDAIDADGNVFDRYKIDRCGCDKDTTYKPWL